jgi:hypothetical protein
MKEINLSTIIFNKCWCKQTATSAAIGAFQQKSVQIFFIKAKEWQLK